MADVTISDLEQSRHGDIKELTSGLTLTEFLPLAMISVWEDINIDFCRGGIVKMMAWVNRASAEGGANCREEAAHSFIAPGTPPTGAQTTPDPSAAVSDLPSQRLSSTPMAPSK